LEIRRFQAVQTQSRRRLQFNLELHLEILAMKTTRWVRAYCAMGASLMTMLLLAGQGRAQDYTYTTNNGTITITRYTGPGGNVTVPGTITGLPVTTVGAGAFQSSGNLVDITLPASLTSIGDRAFWDCSSLVEIGIPRNVTNIGTTAFGQCVSLVAITVDPVNDFYRSVEGVLFDADQRTLIQFPGGKVGNYTIPNGVTNIGSMAFWWSPSVTSVTIPEGVAGIGVDAFGNCSGLTNVTLPNSLTHIDDSAFWACALLSDAKIPNGVTRIGSSGFFGCSSLTSITIPQSVKELGDAAFGACTSVTRVNIENSVLGPAEFSNCTNLTSITIPNTITTITTGAFGGTGLANLTIPQSVTNIGDYAFESCTSLTNVTIPNSVTYLGGGAFAFCAGLRNVSIPDSVTRIGDGLVSKGVVGTFSGCVSLTNVVLGNSLGYIGDGAFFNCSGLTNITIPSSVIHIGDVSFAYSANLTAIYFQGNAPSVSLTAFELLSQVDPTTVYYLPGTTGWEPTLAKRPTALWVLPGPVILNTSPGLGVYDDGFGFRVSWATNAAVVVEACPDILSPAWQTLGTKTLVDGWSEFRDTQWLSFSNRFYRVRWLR
jgi:hypothetical protein